MTEWARVRWSEARQVSAILGWPEDDAVGTPSAFFEELRASGRSAEAANFLSQALPRLETVAWAARCVRDLTGSTAPAPQQAALKATLLWVQDPSEGRRRACQAAADAADPASAEALAAMAAFYSGGSVAPADCPPLPAPRDAAGRFAAGAVLVAVAKATDRENAMVKCLEAGRQLAVLGLTGEVG